MARVKTFTNGGSVFPSDLDAIQDDYEAAASTYKVLRNWSIRLDAPGAPASPFLMVDGYAGDGTAIEKTAALAGASLLYLDPAWFEFSTVNTRSTFLRLVVSLAVNNTAPGVVTYFAAVYQPFAPAGGAATVTLTLPGGGIGGSAVTFASPAANSLQAGNSGDFAAPSAGFVAVGIVATGASAANSSLAFSAQLQMRQV